MDNFNHPAVIEEWKQNLDADTYNKNLNQDLELPSNRKNIDIYF